MKEVAIKSIENIFKRLQDNSQLQKIPRENLEQMFHNKRISDKDYQTWNNLLNTKSSDEIHSLMITDNDLGETLRNTSIFTRIY